MPDEKRYTERDLIKAQRDAFALAGQRWSALNGQTIDKLARQAFPLPPQTRPRVVTDRDGVSWRMNGSVLQSRQPYDGWRNHRGAAAILDVLANPTEPVPDEEG